MGLKEMLAAKKAAAEKEQANVSKESTEKSEAEAFIEQVGSSGQSSNDTPLASLPSNNQGVQNSPSNGIQSEVLVDVNGKPLSGFALIKRRKELAALQEKSNEAKVSQEADPPKQLEEAMVRVERQQQEVVHSEIETLNQTTETSGFSHKAYVEATPESQQAYTDLYHRIAALNALSDLDLKTAMTDLKKALMQNTNAVALMLPSDIGQMVIALRKMTGVELAKAEEKKTGKKAGKKEPMLSADELEAAFKEL